MSARWVSAESIERDDRVTLVEWVVMALISLLGLTLRMWSWDAVGLTHYDEGVYAFSGLGVADPSQSSRLFPEQQKFSPPVYFGLVALSNLVGVDPARSPFVVALLLGAITVPVVWWLFRSQRWAGPVGAVAAAALLATNEFHIGMSRVALTDAGFTLFFMIALAAMQRALDSTDRTKAVVAGIAVGVAWNTKYHGWFVLVIGAMYLVAQRAVLARPNRARREVLEQWGIAAATAALLYVPWTLFIQQQPGASRGWAAYFATMLRLDWIGNAWRHLAQQTYLEGPWTRAGALIALAAAHTVAAARGRSAWPWWSALALGAVAWIGGGALVVAVLATVVLWRGWRARTLDTGMLLLACVVLLWLVMAPIYHPYFRLLLPLLAVLIVLAGRAFEVPPSTDPAASSPAVLPVALACAVGLLLLPPRIVDRSNPWRSHLGLQQAADSIAAHIEAGAPVAVQGEPALAFYLHQRGHWSFARTTFELLDTLSTDRYFVTGVYARRARELREGIESRRDRLTVIGRWPVSTLSDLRILDDFKPDSARQWVVQPDSTYDVILYRIAARRRGALVGSP